MLTVTVMSRVARVKSDLSYVKLLNRVGHMQIPLIIMQHVKHKASALITSTHPPTTVLLPTSLPEERLGEEGVVYFMFCVMFPAA